MKIYYLTRSQHVSAVYVRIICYNANTKSPKHNWSILRRPRRNRHAGSHVRLRRIRILPCGIACECRTSAARNWTFTAVPTAFDCVTRKRARRACPPRSAQYELIITSDKPFHYADDQRGHVIRLPTVRQSIDRPGKRKWRIKKKKVRARQ